MRGGIMPGADPLIFQQSAFNLQLHTEDIYLEAAEAAMSRGETVILLLDR